MSYYTPTPPVPVNDKTELTVPIRNLIGIIIALMLMAWSYFAILERINLLEHEQSKINMIMKMNSEFRVKWPRGEMGSLPADARQDLHIEELNNKFYGITNLQDKINKHEVEIKILQEHIH